MGYCIYCSIFNIIHVKTSKPTLRPVKYVLVLLFSNACIIARNVVLLGALNKYIES